MDITKEIKQISVVIPTFNRPKQLKKCLQGLSVNFPGHAEVIVVSDGGDRDLFPDLSTFASRLNLKVIHADHGGPAAARNIGLAEVQAPIVLYLDDDCIPESGWLDQLSSSVSLDPPVAAGGRTVNGIPDCVYAETFQLILDLVDRDRQTRNYPVFFLSSNNMGFPTEALRAIGGFDSNYQTSEDRELCRRWKRSGYELIINPDAILAHSPRLDLKRFWRKYVGYGEGAAKFHKDTDEDWGLTFAYHFRIPKLLWAEMSEKKLKKRFRICLLVLVWEVANLAGFLKGRLKTITVSRS